MSLAMTYEIDGMKILIKKSRRNKYLRLSIRPSNCFPILTIPTRTTLKTAHDFLNEKRDWLNKHKQFLSNPFHAITNDELPSSIHYLGTVYKIVNTPLDLTKERIHLCHESKTLFICSMRKCTPLHLKKWMQKQALEISEQVSHQFAKQLGVYIKSIQIKNYKSKWGSCHIDGRLTFSWRLIMAPLEVFSYVCAHEVAHLVHHNHSASFWKVVAQLDPHFQSKRLWLKKEGYTLHRALL